MHRAVGVGIVTLVLVLAPSCDKTKEEASSAGATTGSATAAAAPVTDVDEMLRRSFTELGDEYFASTIDIDYVRADGTLDPTYGEMTIEAGKRLRPRPPKPAADPNRPVGAPEPPDTSLQDDMIAMAMAKCPHITWSTGRLVVRRDATCSMFRQMLQRPRCTIAGILAAAREAGAPANALAKISFDVGYGEEAVQTWSLSIDDNPRDIHFKHEGKDDCQPIVEKP